MTTNALNNRVDAAKAPNNGAVANAVAPNNRARAVEAPKLFRLPWTWNTGVTAPAPVRRS
jgi:hypothetical protein